MNNNKLLIDSLLLLDDTGMPQPPTLKQLIDRDVRQLYRRDKTKEKKMYIAECIVIYYLGDPKSPAKQSGLSDPEALKMAIEQAGLPKTYIPDVLVLRLIKRYYEENITEAGKVVENILKGETGAKRDIVIINAGVAFYITGFAKTIQDGIKLATETIDKGLAFEKLNELRNF